MVRPPDGEYLDAVGGEALEGPFEGVKLEQVPAYTGAVEPWVDAHPDTKVLVVPNANYGVAERLKDDFVIGVSSDAAVAFDYRASAGETAVNHFAGVTSVLVYVDRETQAVRVFEREVDGQILSFRWTGTRLQDGETGSALGPDERLGAGRSPQGQAPPTGTLYPGLQLGLGTLP